MTNPVPTSIDQLQRNMDAIAGCSVAELAAQCQVGMPDNLLVDKGWVGQLLELSLGATAGNLAAPDFEHLGIELKTLPLTEQGKVQETTFVCTAPLNGTIGAQWRESLVYKKLRHVLWVPIIVANKASVADRRIGQPFLWQPSEQQEAILQQDWQELTDLIAYGRHDKITAKLGEALQLRPKAADGSVRTAAYDQDGNPTIAPPKGFYLRSGFTQSIINEMFNL